LKQALPFSTVNREEAKRVSEGLKQKIQEKAKTLREKVMEALTKIENLRYERVHGDLDQSFPILTRELHNLIIDIEKVAQQEIDIANEELKRARTLLEDAQRESDKAIEDRAEAIHKDWSVQCRKCGKSYESVQRERGLQKQKLRSILEDMQKIPERRLPLDKIGWLQEWGDVIVALGRLLE
jgi:RIO-like serine/threonine protein kinase